MRKVLYPICGKAMMLSLLSVSFFFSGCVSEVFAPENKEDTQNTEQPDSTEQGCFVSSFSIEKVTATTASFYGSLNVAEDDLSFSKVVVYYSAGETFNINDAMSVVTTSFDESKGFKISLTGLTFGTDYKYCISVKVKSNEEYSDVSSFTTDDISIKLSVENTSFTTAAFSAEVSGVSEEDEGIEMGVMYYCGNSMNYDEAVKLATDSGALDSFILTVGDLNVGAEYCYCPYVQMERKTVFGEESNFISEMPGTIDLSADGTANCYIVSSPGIYKIRTVQGNSDIALKSVASADVLWESFGTDVSPKPGDLISWSAGSDGYVYFEVPSDFKEGNAVIASRNAENTILWSWHIWLTDEPQEQVYFNDAGIMMDRNLGATSANPGDFCSLGLLYQWGRKDPFLNIREYGMVGWRAESTLKWPGYTGSNSETGTIAYVTENPTMLISGYGVTDWYYAEDGTTDRTRWQSVKTMYDPCPAGWRVPDIDIWDAATNYNGNLGGYEGGDFSGILGDDEVIWYPAWSSEGGQGLTGFYWSVTPSGSQYFCQFSIGFMMATEAISGGSGEYAVRCCKE